MGAKNSTLSFDTGIQMQKKRRTSYKKSHRRKKSHSHKKRHTKKNHFPNMPFPKQPSFPKPPSFSNPPSFPKPPPFPNMPFPNMPCHKKSCKSSNHRHHHTHTHKKSKKHMILPGGNWINTAKDFYIINNILYAKLRTKSGNYIHDQTVFFPNQKFQNKDGRFSLLLY